MCSRILRLEILLNYYTFNASIDPPQIFLITLCSRSVIKHSVVILKLHG